MRGSSLVVAKIFAVALSTASLLCTSTSPVLSQTATPSARSLPDVTVDAPKRAAKPPKLRQDAVYRPVLHSAAPAMTPPATATRAASTSTSAKLAKLASAGSSCLDGCATSMRYGKDPWHGCSISSGVLSSTCRNPLNLKNYNECKELGLAIGWRDNEMAWYCSSIALR